MINQHTIRDKLSRPSWGATEPHTGLWLDRYILGQSRDEHDNRRELIEKATALPEANAYQVFFSRWEKALQEYHAQTRRAQVKGRMVVGLGSESVLETAICLHRTYGVPYIPGSALKGLAASYAHQRLSEEWQQGGALHTVIFGDTETAGYVIFLDALYVPGSGRNGRALYQDVIAVHHPGYYQDASKAPSDSDDPTPVPFLSATGTYLLALAVPDLQQSDPQHSTRWLDITFQILAEALDQLGIGAKTSSGYGRMALLDVPMKPVASAMPAVDPDMQRAEDARRRLEALRESDVAGQINSYYQQWQRLTSQEARTLLAQAIIEKVRKANREKASAEKAWYKELLAFLAEK